MSQAPDKKYRIWSLTSQKYMVLKEDGGSNPTADCTGTEEQQSSKLHILVCYNFVDVAASDFCYVILFLFIISQGQITCSWPLHSTFNQLLEIDEVKLVNV